MQRSLYDCPAIPVGPLGTLYRVVVAMHPAGKKKSPLRVVYGASIRSCRPCPLRERCQWNGHATAKPRQVSVLLHPLQVGASPLLWRDWSRRAHRRSCMRLVRHQRIEVSVLPTATVPPQKGEVIFSRAQRAHYRLSWHVER